MNQVILLVVVVLVVAAIGAAIYFMRRKRSLQLRIRFGPEYDRAVEEAGPRVAERALVDRTRRVEKLEIRPLPVLRRDELSKRWQAVQAQFVDDPASALREAHTLLAMVCALREAHTLLAMVMHEQGYPTGRFAEEVELLSVHHPAAVQHYRAAHRIADEQGAGRGATEDLRQAMIHYRALFDDLLIMGANPARDIQPRREVRHEA
jgi:hypothetical protein